MKKTQFLDYIIDCLSPFGSITSRAMFGGYGLYNEGVIFAVIIKDELYFKATKETEEFFKSKGSNKFTYQGKNGIVSMNYWKVDPDLLEDQDSLKEWFNVAIGCKNNTI